MIILDVRLIHYTNPCIRLNNKINNLDKPLKRVNRLYNNCKLSFKQLEISMQGRKWIRRESYHNSIREEAITNTYL